MTIMKINVYYMNRQTTQHKQGTNEPTNGRPGHDVLPANVVCARNDDDVCLCVDRPPRCPSIFGDDPAAMQNIKERVGL